MTRNLHWGISLQSLMQPQTLLFAAVLVLSVSTAHNILVFNLFVQLKGCSSVELRLISQH